jgi:CheY-like chemotaxis protein
MPEQTAQVVLVYFDEEEHERLAAALPNGVTVAVFREGTHAIDYLQFADTSPTLIVFDLYTTGFDGLLLCARLRELCQNAAILPVGGSSDTTTVLEQMGCLPAIVEDDPNIAAHFQAALDAPPPPLPTPLVRALITEARVAEAHIRRGDDGDAVLVYATTQERAERLRKKFNERGPVFVASDLDELQALADEHYPALFVATAEDALLAEPIMERENLEREFVDLRL